MSDNQTEIHKIKGFFRCYRKDDLKNYDHFRLYVFEEVPFTDDTKKMIEYFVWVDHLGIEHHDMSEMGIEDLDAEGWKQIAVSETIPITEQAKMTDLVLG